LFSVDVDVGIYRLYIGENVQDPVIYIYGIDFIGWFPGDF